MSFSSVFKRYMRVYLILLRLNLAHLFAYRINFINSVISHTVWAVLVIVSMLLLTSKTSNVFGWTRNDLLIFAAMYNIVMSTFYVLFSRNFNQFQSTIHFGRLDTLLIKPIDTQFLLSCWHIGYTQLIRFSIGVFFLIYMLNKIHLQITLLTLVGLFCIVILSVVIMYSFWFIMMTLTIWFTKLSNMVDLLYAINSVSRFPQDIYKGASAFLMFALFPLTLIITVPARVILNKMLIGDVVWPIIFSVGMLFCARKFWKFALRYYTSASG